MMIASTLSFLVHICYVKTDFIWKLPLSWSEIMADPLNTEKTWFFVILYLINYWNLNMVSCCQFFSERKKEKISKLFSSVIFIWIWEGRGGRNVVD